MAALGLSLTAAGVLTGSFAVADRANAATTTAATAYVIQQHARIGIRHPHRADAFAEVLSLRGRRAIATSGAYERGRHIIDPRSGRPAEGLLSVTVVGANLEVVDVAATAIFVLGVEGLTWLTGQKPGAAFSGLEAMVITADHECIETPGFTSCLATSLAA